MPKSGFVSWSAHGSHELGILMLGQASDLDCLTDDVQRPVTEALTGAGSTGALALRPLRGRMPVVRQ